MGQRRFSLLLLLFVGLTVGCSKPTGTPLGAAQAFFDQVHRGELKAAFESSSFAFQTQQNLKFFTERTREYGLGEAAVALTLTDTEAKIARLNADITKKNGLKYTLVVTMHLEENLWRVHSIRSPRNPSTGYSEDRFSIVGKSATIVSDTTKRVPSEADLRKLVNDSLVLFSDAILTKNFWEFYEFAAVAWQKELTEQKLQNAFGSFIDKQVDMSQILHLQPIFDEPPEIGSDGLLAITGHYPTKPYEVHFSLRYIFELPEWKLLGLNCYLKKVDGAPATPTPAH